MKVLQIVMTLFVLGGACALVVLALTSCGSNARYAESLQDCITKAREAAVTTKEQRLAIYEQCADALDDGGVR